MGFDPGPVDFFLVIIQNHMTTSIPWYDDITKRIDVLDTKCRINGPMYKYKGEPNGTNPYSYGNGIDFGNKVVGKLDMGRKFASEHCKMQHVDSKKDKYGRYYKHVHSYDNCLPLRGIWDPESGNRHNKFRKGVCWTGREDAACGKHLGRELVLPMSVTDDVKRAQVTLASQNKCSADDACSWVPMTNGANDCFSKKRLDKKADSVTAVVRARDPPSNMPGKSGLQTFMEEWYKSPTSPKVGILEGKGNRCVPTASATTAEASVMNPAYAKHYTMEELKALPIPLSENDRSKFVNAFGTNRVAKFENSRGYIRAKKGIRDEIDKNSIWTEIPYYFVEEEIDDGTIPKEVEIVEEFLPSPPQSVVNMIMKHIAITKSTDRGMMAWHSTGSGKTCTAAGVMDSFWDSDKQIVFASSINAIASNPDYKFHECASRLYPRFKDSPFHGDMGIIGSKFAERGIIFISFAKLANRIQKTETFKELLGIVGSKKTKGIKGGARRQAKRIEEDEYPKKKKNKQAASKKIVYEDEEEDDEPVKKPVKKTGKKIVYQDEEDDEYPKKKQVVKAKGKKASYDDEPIKKPTRQKSKKVVYEDEEEDEPIKKPVRKMGKKIVYDDEDDEPVKKPVGKMGKKIVYDDEDDEPLAKTKATYPLVPATKAMLDDPFLNRIAAWYGLSNNLPKVKDALRQANIAGVEDFVDLDNTVLIIDEVHNLFRPLPAQKEKHNYVEKHIVDPTQHPNLKVVILTATPGDNVKDVMKLINIVRNPNSAPITPPNPEDPSSVARFKASIAGLVSYFEMSNDITKFPQVRDMGPKYFPMSNTQFARYIDAYNDVKADSKNYDKLANANQLSKFWAGARKYSNMLYTFEKGMALTEFSSKLPALLENISLSPLDKHYAYSAFYERRGSGQGILAIASELEKAGYEKLTLKEAKEANRSGKELKTKRRYILAIQSELGEEGSSSAGDNLDELIRIYNSSANKTGDLVHVFLASQSFNEGLDLKAVKHIHIFEPLVTMASDLQTIGRARRYCSHADLDLDQWTVEIHRYLTDLPVTTKVNITSGTRERLHAIKNTIETLKDKIKETKDASEKLPLKENLAELQKDVKGIEADIKKVEKADVKNVESVDRLIYKEAQDRMRLLFVTYHCMKEAAIDCKILHKFHADGKIVCS